MTLLDDKYAPVTAQIGFLRVPLDEASKAFTVWRAEIHGTAKVTPLSGGLVENVLHLEPLTAAVRPRELLIATGNPEWTAVLDCGTRRDDHIPPVGYLSRALKCQGLVLCSVPFSGPGPRSPYGGIQFSMFGPLRTHFLSYVRTNNLVQDGSPLRFDAPGTEQIFEETAASSPRRVTDRFTLQMLARYCAALGLRPFDEDFYPGPSVLVASPQSAPAARALSLAETPKWLHIHPG
jgi:hypothetical protein